MNFLTLPKADLLKSTAEALNAIGYRLVALSATEADPDKRNAYSASGEAVLRAARAYQRHMGNDPAWLLE